jgi:hypothetical protein
MGGQKPAEKLQPSDVPARAASTGVMELKGKYFKKCHP